MCVNCQNCEAVGKLFADLWKRLVFFHQVVNGFSISTSGSFPYFHDARKSTNNQPVYCQWHIPFVKIVSLLCKLIQFLMVALSVTVHKALILLVFLNHPYQSLAFWRPARSLARWRSMS